MGADKRISAIDIAKGIGILLVITGHVLPLDSPVRMFIYTFHMPLFFILAGMVMKSPGYKKSIFADILEERKLIGSYCLYSILYIMLDEALCFVGEEIITEGLFWNCYMTIVFYGINVLWFLATLVLAKILVKWICRIPVKGIYWLIIGIVFYAAGSMAIVKVERLTWMEAYPVIALLRALSMVVYILLGYVAGRKIKEYMKEMGIGSAACITVAAVLFLLLVFHVAGDIDIHVMRMGNWPVAFVCGVIGTIMILSASVLLDKIKGIGGLLRYMGIHSLFIMATHNYPEVPKFVNGCLEKSNLLSSRYVRLLQIILLCVLECTACKICSLCMERTKNFLRNKKRDGMSIEKNWNNIENVNKG